MNFGFNNRYYYCAYSVERENSQEAYNYAQFTNARGFSDFYEKNSYLNGFIENPTILGVPSIDGRGPMFSENCSVAISKTAVNIEACGEFIKILLSDEIQG